MTQELFLSGQGNKSFKPVKRCHSYHKPLQFGDGVLLGGACGSPRSGYDIYIGFDGGMQFNHSAYPWETDDDAVIEFQYRITDMCAPKSPKVFIKMVDWIVEQLHAGKRIHMGCIGGHGRTGLVIAAVKKVWDGEEDAIAWTRKNHCKKSVESESQVGFLVKHFGCKAAKPTKQSFHHSSTGLFGGTHSARSATLSGKLSGRYRNNSNKPKIDRKKAPEKLSFVSGKGSIWG